MTKDNELKIALDLFTQDRKKMQEDLKEIKEDMKSIQTEFKEDMKSFQSEFKEFTNSLDNKYAKKTSVDRLWNIVWMVIGAVFLSLGGAILKMFIK
ncbi:MAG: hypothetical protein HG439_004665 [candidate division SR1 bacterium]|nr:hypothetical protein [candidate division SR1 bacterium]MBB1578531.1 hypothetical protein [candidate division SR1 bacterium]MBF0932050.1 hypothetical protein [candidate division SR1 bacterium]